MGNAQIRTVLAKTVAGQQIGITPVTEIATQTVLASIGSNPNVGLAEIISSTNANVGSAMGLSDITIPPANPNKSATSSTQQAAQYAVVLATISQIAQAATSNSGASICSLDIMQSLASSFTYNGNFNSQVNGQNVPVPNVTGIPLNLSFVLNSIGGNGTTFSAAMVAAMNTYVNTPAASGLGFANVALVPPPTFITSPTPAVGQVGLTHPTPPNSLPSSPPTVAGPPATTPGASPAATPFPLAAGWSFVDDNSSAANRTYGEYVAAVVFNAKLYRARIG